MAALGAGAGAHRGDMERDALDEKRRQADMQNRQSQDALAQRGREFAMNLGQRQSEQEEATRRYDSSVKMTEEQNKYQRERNEQIDSLNVEQKQYERGRFDRLDAQSQEQVEYQRGREAKQDGWADVLNKLTVEQKEQEFAKNNEVLEKYREARKIEREQIENRQRLAHSHAGAMFMDVMENNGVGSQAGLNIFNEATGQNIKGMYVVEDKGIAIDYEDENGETKTNFIPMSVAREYASALYGSDRFGGKGGSESAMQSALNSAERNRLMAEANARKDILAEEKHKITRGESFLKNLERRIDALKEDLNDYPDPEIEKKIKEEIKNLRKLHNDVSIKVYGEDYIDDDKGGDKGGGKLPTFVNSVIEKLYGMTGVELKDRLRRIARAKNQEPEAVLFGMLKGETEENKKAFFESLK